LEKVSSSQSCPGDSSSAQEKSKEINKAKEDIDGSKENNREQAIAKDTHSIIQLDSLILTQ